MVLSPERIDEIKALSEKLQFEFNDLSLLNKALTHRSYANESGDPEALDNERFEFLGDSVLDLIVADYVLGHERRFREGELSRIRAQVVNEQALAEVATELALGDLLLLGRGEESSGGREKPSLLANAVEAVIAAVYVDSSYDVTAKTFLPIFREKIDSVSDGPIDSDSKGRLQRLLKGRESQISYRLVDERGPDHDKEFTVRLYIDDSPYGEGEGRTKKEAEQIAAKIACDKLESERNS